jgi:mono/diheme cytochrome c family protein
MVNTNKIIATLNILVAIGHIGDRRGSAIEFPPPETPVENSTQMDSSLHGAAVSLGYHRPMPRTLAAIIALSLALSACAGAKADVPLKAGRTVYGNVCSACHGSSGQGGVGPSLEKVAETFPSCDDQIEWITLGSDNWKRTYGDTYGTPSRPIEGGMPSHAESLTSQQIAAVAAWERSTYGGLNEQEAIDQCNVEIADE